MAICGILSNLALNVSNPWPIIDHTRAIVGSMELTCLDVRVACDDKKNKMLDILRFCVVAVFLSHEWIIYNWNIT